MSESRKTFLDLLIKNLAWKIFYVALFAAFGLWNFWQRGEPLIWLPISVSTIAIFLKDYFEHVLRLK